MADLVIRDVPDDVIELVEDKAQMARLGREEYLRRLLTRQSSVPEHAGRTTVQDFERLAELCSDLIDNPEVYGRLG